MGQDNKVGIRNAYQQKGIVTIWKHTYTIDYINLMLKRLVYDFYNTWPLKMELSENQFSGKSNYWVTIRTKYFVEHLFNIVLWEHNTAKPIETASICSTLMLLTKRLIFINWASDRRKKEMIKYNYTGNLAGV